MQQKQLIAIAVLFAMMCNMTSAFHEIPHMIVLGIAKRDLLATDPEIFKIAEKYLGFYDKIGVYDQNIFEENAIWADDIKKYGEVANFWSSWHYDGKNTFNPDSIKIPEFDKILDTENILNAYTRIKSTLALKDFKGKITETKVFLLKMLVHLVGDIHMPNHAGSFYNNTFVQGDQGGNKINIQFNGQKTNLHFYFDSGCFFYNFKQRLVRPANDTFISYFKGEMDRLQALYPKETLTALLNPDFELKDWAKESWDIAQTFIYPYFAKTTLVDQDYYNKSFDMIQKQIVLAGYRLSQSLKLMLAPEKGMYKFDTDNTKPPVTDPSKPIVTDPSNPNVTNPIKNNENNTQNEQNNDYVHDDAVNKSVAIVFGVLFGMTFIGFIAYIVVQKITLSKPMQYQQQRLSGGLPEMKTLNEFKSPSEQRV